MCVIYLRKLKNKETVDVLKRLLEQAENGDLHGICFCTQLGNQEHVMGVSGAYRTNPLLAIAATSQMLKRLGSNIRNFDAGATDSAISASC